MTQQAVIILLYFLFLLTFSVIVALMGGMLLWLRWTHTFLIEVKFL